MHVKILHFVGKRISHRSMLLWIQIRFIVISKVERLSWHLKHGQLKFIPISLEDKFNFGAAFLCIEHTSASDSDVMGIVLHRIETRMSGHRKMRTSGVS